MESSVARAKEEDKKTSQDQIKNKLQEILTSMNDYIRKHPDTVRSPISDRILSIKRIATAIYGYYRQVTLVTDFESNLGDFFNFLDDAVRTGKSTDSKHLKLLPELKDVYKSEGLPRALHGYHAIIGLIQNEIKQMPSWRGRSELRDNLVNAISGYDIIAQDLGTNIYLVVYLDELTYIEMTRRPVDFANYLYEALTTSRIYQDGLMAATFNGANKSYHIAFCSSRSEAVSLVGADHPVAGCFGAEFSFTLRKASADDVGQYVPLLSSVRQMDIWKMSESAKFNNQYSLECHAAKPEFVIARQQPVVQLKK